MKSSDSISQNWDDLVFENRNKEYGAYAIRKSYPNRLLEGVATACLFGGLLFLYSQLVALFPASHPPKMSEDGGIILNPPPIIRMIEKAKTVFQQFKKSNADVIPKVTARPVEEVELPTATQGRTSDTQTNGETTSSSGEIGPITDEVGAVKVIPIVDFAEVMPSYDGGMAAMMRFVQKKMRYPHSAQVMGVEGTVYVQFVVDYEGRVADVKVVRGISADCDNEAARVIALMPGWKPGTQNKMPVSVRMVLPIKFKLEN